MKRFQMTAMLLTAAMLAGAGIPAQAAEETFHRTRLGEYKLVTEPDSETEPKTLRYASTKREYNIYSVYGDGSSGVKIEFDFDKAEATEKMDEIVAALKKAVPAGFNFQKYSTYGMFNQNEFRIKHLNYREAAALYDTISKQYPLKAFHYYPDCGSFNYSGISLFISAEDAVRVNEYLKANAPDWYYDSVEHRMGSNQPYSAYDLCRMIYKVSEEFGFKVGGMTTELATFGADGFDTDFVKLDAQYKEISEAQTQAAYDKYIKDAALEKRETVRLTVRIPNETLQQMQDDLGIPAAYCRTDYLTPTETHRTESYIAEALKLSGNYQLLEARNAYTVSTGKATDADAQFFAVMCRTEPNTGDVSNAYPKDTDAAQIIAYLTESNPYNIEYLVSEAYYTGGKNPLILQKGDLNGDGTVSAEDAQLVLNLYTEIVAERALADANQLAAADINQDGELSADDAQIILLYYTENILTGNPVSWEDLLKA